MSTTYFHGTRRQALDIVDGMDLCLAPQGEYEPTARYMMRLIELGLFSDKEKTP